MPVRILPELYFAAFVILVLAFVILILARALVSSRRQVSELMDRLMAKNLPEYAQLKNRLDTSPKDRLSLVKEENKLAESAAKLTDYARSTEQGVPVGA